MNTYYISPSGSDSNNGSINSPWKSWARGTSPLLAGDVLYFRAGTHPMSGNQSLSNKQGTAAANILIAAYPGEKVVFDWSAQPGGAQVRGINFNNCAYVILKGIRVTGIAQKQNQGSYNYGISWNASVNNCVMDTCEADHIGGTGIQCGANCNNNLLVNCDSHHNDDPYSVNGAHENSNGYEIAGNVTGNKNTLRGCRAWWNADDGFDMYNGATTMILENCWSFWNGYLPGTKTPAPGGDGNGFKLGPGPAGTTVLRTLTNCLAFENTFMGITYNQGDFPCVLYNNTAYKNGNVGFYFANSKNNILKNNIAFGQAGGGGQSGAINSQSTQANNSWQGFNVTAADFQSLSSVGVDGPRQPDGSLPSLPFLRLAPTSGLINKGVPVGLPYSGTAPDLGAFESGSVTPPPTNYASVEQSVTLTRNNCVLPAVGSSVKYTVAAGKYTSTVSQADADSKASADLTANGQNYANTNGTCNISGPTVVQTFRRNGVTYTLMSDHTWHQ